MSDPIERAKAFARLHVKGDPVVLYNVWDAGGAQAVAKAGASAIATGSWSVAAAQGYADGERIPLDEVAAIAARIVAAVDLPVTIDFEGAYAQAPEDVAANLARILDAGAVGVNFEDQIVGGAGLHAPDAQAARIAAMRAEADRRAAPFFINARTDLFLKEKDLSRHDALADEAIARAAAYQAAGASGFFIPGAVDEALIARICDAVELPVNVMMRPGAPSLARLAELGVARVSYGPAPYFALMRALGEAAAAVYAKP